ncbi:DNA repair protein RAD50 [Trypanosoma cruzi]|nr:DNA repair protein RAD50 [Trypanosoma cruzi]
MLQLSRLLQCVRIASSSSSSSSLFASLRAFSNGRRVGKKALASATSGEAREVGGDEDTDDSADMSHDTRSELGRTRPNIDFASFEADANDGGMMPLPLRGGLQLPPSQHQKRQPRRLGFSLPSSLSSLPEEVLQATNASHPLDAARRERRVRGAREEEKEEEEEEEEGDDDEEAGMENEHDPVDTPAAFPNGYTNHQHNHNKHNNEYDVDIGKATLNNTINSHNSNNNNNNYHTNIAGLTNPFLGLHEHITRSYRLDQLLAVARPEDILMGRQEAKSGAFSFIRFESGPQFLASNAKSSTTPRSEETPHNDCALVVAERLMAFPPHMRHFHSICGRENVPCDFFADVDLPNETPVSGEKLLLEMLNYLEVRLEGIGFHQPSFLVLANEVPSPDKVSYHVHARSMGAMDEKTTADDEEGDDDANEHENEDEEADLAGTKGSPRGKRRNNNNNKKAAKAKKGQKQKKIIAFQDYRVVRLLADEVNTTLGRTVVDEQCYRANGMLRCAFSSKIAPSPNGGVVRQKGKRLVPMLKAQDTALQRRLNEMSAYLNTLSEAEVLERTFGTRFAPITGSQKADTVKDSTRQFKLLRARNVLGPKEAQAVEFDAYGNAVSLYLTEGAKWRRFKMVIEKLRRMPPRSAESYDIWVRVGLALHNFSNEDHVFEEWVRFSLKCPQKYSRESCRKKWQQFERNPDALNWRRGFNYLNTTVWRSVHRE